jgi:hypothetical protein
MSQGAPHDVSNDAAARSAALLRPLFSRARGARLSAANDNRPDWRSLVARRVTRPLRRLLTFFVAMFEALWRTKR